MWSNDPIVERFLYLARAVNYWKWVWSRSLVHAVAIGNEKHHARSALKLSKA